MAFFRVRWHNGITVIRQAHNSAAASARGERESGRKVLQVEALDVPMLSALMDSGYSIPVAARRRVGLYRAQVRAGLAAIELWESSPERADQQRAFDEAQRIKDRARREAREAREKEKRRAKAKATREENKRAKEAAAGAVQGA